MIAPQLNKLNVPHSNFRRAVPALGVAIVSFIIAVLAQVFGASLIAAFAFISSIVGLVSYFALVVPWMMLGVSLILAPFAVYFWGDSQVAPILGKWWFWLLSAVSFFGSVGALWIAGRRYPPRARYE